MTITWNNTQLTVRKFRIIPIEVSVCIGGQFLHETIINMACVFRVRHNTVRGIPAARILMRELWGGRHQVDKDDKLSGIVLVRAIKVRSLGSRVAAEDLRWVATAGKPVWLVNSMPDRRSHVLNCKLDILGLDLNGFFYLGPLRFSEAVLD
jgi:hypothetical protein